ncbi:MAG: hypothetical protein IIA70_04700 [Proteobacteria bacterium]|nr:hypothetical protein [Pseudomonadota bacterium]
MSKKTLFWLRQAWVYLMGINEIKIFGLILGLGSLIASLGMLSALFEELQLRLFLNLFFGGMVFLILFFVFKISRSTSQFDFGKMSLFPKFNKDYQKGNLRGFLLFSSLALLLNGFMAFQAPNFFFGAVMFFSLSGLSITGFGFLFSILKPY